MLERIDRIRRCADLSIRRACGFGLLAIATTMVGASAQAVLAFKIGAVSATLMAVILILKALEAPRRSYKRTEVWYMLDRRHGLPESRAQHVFSSVLRERYLWHATAAGMLALALWGITFLLRLFGPSVA